MVETADGWLKPFHARLSTFSLQSGIRYIFASLQVRWRHL
jgi:hypothetical protein